MWQTRTPKAAQTWTPEACQRWADEKEQQGLAAGAEDEGAAGRATQPPQEQPPPPLGWIDYNQEQQGLAAGRATQPPPPDAQEDMDTTPEPAATPDIPALRLTPGKRTFAQWQAFNQQFIQNNVKRGQMDLMYKKWSHAEWDQYLWRMDDRGLENSFNWPRVRWYDWLLASRAREQKEAEEVKETQRLLEEQMYGPEEGEGDLDAPFPGTRGKRRRHT